jgi:2-polyprenyl-3-methyl-5-hydroxy-6-metoxy-1,4-benzoquinol methylase
MSARTCRFCRAVLEHTFVDLGMSPLSNAFLKAEQLSRMEPFYPLHAYVCSTCFLVQLEQFESPDRIFNAEYAYFSSFSDSWLEHARRYTDEMIASLGLDAHSFVVEIASNDGYLLQYFVALGVPALGIEPAANVAEVAVKKGIPTVVKFFGEKTAQELRAADKQADLLLGNNVLAHVPDLNGFVKGLKILLKPQGVITMEFPHLMRLMDGNQFDTIYHEHFSYFSFITVEKVFAAHGLKIFDVEELSTHGGSLPGRRPSGAAWLRRHRRCSGGASEPRARVSLARSWRRSRGRQRRGGSRGGHPTRYDSRGCLPPPRRLDTRSRDAT